MFRDAGRAWHDECRHFERRRHVTHPRVAQRAIQLQIIGYHRAQIVSLASPCAADWLGQRRFCFRVQMRRRAMRRSCLTRTASSTSIVSCLLTGCDITIRVRSLNCDVEHRPYFAAPSLDLHRRQSWRQKSSVSARARWISVTARPTVISRTVGRWCTM